MYIDVREAKPKPVDYKKYIPYFLHSSTDMIEKTFNATTQYGRSGWIDGTITQTMKAPFPALNVRRRHESVATDTVYSDTAAIDSGVTSAQFFVGCDSLYGSVHPMKTDKQFVNTLWDEIRKRGAMDKLVSDRAQVEIGKKVKDILRYLVIDDWQSEPYYQQQNPAERRYRHVKANTNKTMNRTGAPAYTWLLCMMYVLFIMNRMATSSLGDRTPHERLWNSTPDISMITRFQFWEPVYYSIDKDTKEFPSLPSELKGRFVGFSEDVGHAMTYKVLTDDTQKVIYRSRIRSAVGEFQKNFRLEDIDKFEEYVKSVGEKEGKPMKVVDTIDLIDRTFLMPPEEDGTRVRAKVIEAIQDKEAEDDNNPTMKKFKCSVDDGKYEAILSYNEILGKLEEDEEAGIFKFKSIDAHQGPLSTRDPSYKGSGWNVRVNWENGETTYEPLDIMAKEDPVTCAIYAKDNGLLDTPGWKRFKRIARRQKKLLRLANQAKLKAFRLRKVYKFGVEIPQNHAEAMRLDRENHNTLWRDAEKKELAQIDEYDVFIDKGKGGNIPSGFKKITVHFVYDCKHDGRRKARLVAGGHLTPAPDDSTYSSVVSLRGLRIVIFLAELNGLQLWGTDIGNAYLEAKTKEKVLIIAGPEFGPREGHTLIIDRALYGLKSSGLRWHERFSDVLRDMGFVPSKAENDIWMKHCGDHYEYIARYVDDLAVASRNPDKIMRALTGTYKFKLKGTGPLSYHLGCDYM